MYRAYCFYDKGNFRDCVMFYRQPSLFCMVFSLPYLIDSSKLINTSAKKDPAQLGL